MYIISLSLILIFAFITFFFLINLKWCVETIRNISSPRNRGGYTKLIQMGLIALLAGLFTIISFYYLLNGGTVDRVDIILTVVVGWLGAIIGKFFGERAMENLDDERKNYAEKMNLVLDKYEHFLDQAFPELKKK
tara:strand:+ start:1755 stop:2159 length:405 start_codon:yes stop_codon:yes gene_type:complete